MANDLNYFPIFSEERLDDHATVRYGDGSIEDYAYTDDNRLDTLTNRKVDSWNESTFVEYKNVTYSHTKNSCAI